MKYVIFLLLVPLFAMARFNPGTVTMNDGSTKSGTLEIPNFNDKYMRFRSEGGKTEHLKPDDVASFTVTANDITYYYKTVVLWTPRLFNIKKWKADKHRRWFEILRTGKVEMLSGYYFDRASGPHAGPSIGGYVYALIFEGEDHAVLFTQTITTAGVSYVAGMYKAVVKSTEFHFKERCPALLDAMTREIIDEKGLTWIADYYNTHCAP